MTGMRNPSWKISLVPPAMDPGAIRFQAGGDAALIGGTIMVDQTVLSSKDSAKKALIGTPTSGPQADSWDDPKWQAYVKAYQDAFAPDKRFPSPSLLATAGTTLPRTGYRCRGWSARRARTRRS